jgi:hypothetical protein
MASFAELHDELAGEQIHLQDGHHQLEQFGNTYVVVELGKIAQIRTPGPQRRQGAVPSERLQEQILAQEDAIARAKRPYENL